MNTATLTRVLQRSMYVLKIANASRNHATAFGTLLGFAVSAVAKFFESTMNATKMPSESQNPP